MADVKKVSVKPVAKAAASAVKPAEAEVKKEVAAAVKKEVAAVKKEAAKAAPAKKAPAKKAEKKAEPAAKKSSAKNTITLEFKGNKYTEASLVQSAKDVWVYDLGKDIKDFKSVDLFVKPEDNTVYYVINGDVTGGFAL